MDISMGAIDSGSLQRKAMEELERKGVEQGGPTFENAGVNENDLERLNVILENSKSQRSESLEVHSNPQPQTEGISEPNSMAEKILRGMTSVSGQVQENTQRAISAINTENVNQADLLKANFAMLESSNLVSAISKTTEKITQGLKTLQQG